MHFLLHSISQELCETSHCCSHLQKGNKEWEAMTDSSKKSREFSGPSKDSNATPKSKPATISARPCGTSNTLSEFTLWLQKHRTCNWTEEKISFQNVSNLLAHHSFAFPRRLLKHSQHSQNYHIIWASLYVTDGKFQHRDKKRFTQDLTESFSKGTDPGPTQSLNYNTCF